MAAITFVGDTPANKVLRHLQRHGEASVRDLEEVLGISTTAVREHITNLQTRGLIDTKLVRTGPGRPKQVYFLTSAAQAQFPKAYDTLVNMLLRELANRQGSEQLDVLLDAVGSRLAEEYKGQIPGEELQEKLDGLRKALEARSIPVEVQPSGQGFQVFSCPYLDVAQEHEAVCRMERRMMEQVLGEDLQIEGTIREGHRSCSFKVRNEE
ncbi:winged helix-turn-helix transcriptional regulator [Chloroflexia bacterium SDU3-3]|nr:winged helix-turn-helix transcriptional regulator [Chloroflexia bacterium SDU3-3]